MYMSQIFPKLWLFLLLLLLFLFMFQLYLLQALENQYSVYSFLNKHKSQKSRRKGRTARGRNRGGGSKTASRDPILTDKQIIFLEKSNKVMHNSRLKIKQQTRISSRKSLNKIAISGSIKKIISYSENFFFVISRDVIYIPCIVQATFPL